MEPIPLIKPYVTDEVKREVLQVLESGYLTEGPVTHEFEKAVKDYVSARHAIAVCNCTVGLEMALRALGVGPGDEVIVPDYTYPATASAAAIVGATVVIVDVNPDTMLIDYPAIESAITEHTKAVMPVSIFGNPLDYKRLDPIKSNHDLRIVEDAACSLGARCGGTAVGNLADISVFSLHPRKFITTGEGGVITTNSDEWAEWMESYKHFGMKMIDSRGAIQFVRIGTNYKLSNISAAVGLAQMRHIQTLLNRRRHLASRYYEMLSNHRGVRLPEITAGSEHSWQSCCVFIENRDNVIQKMKERGIETQIGTYALHMHRAYNDSPNCRIEGDMPGSRYAFEHCLALPLYHEMTLQEQDYVIKHLIDSL